MPDRRWKRLGGYVKLSIQERREAVKEMSGDRNSQRRIAGVLGVDDKTVRNDLRGAENSAVSPGNHEGTDGRGAENSALDSLPLDVMTGLAADDDLRAQMAKQEQRKLKEQMRAMRRDGATLEAKATGVSHQTVMRVTDGECPNGHSEIITKRGQKE